MFKESFTSYNRQIRQLEKNRDELPNTNAAGRTNISRRINALKRAKGLANVRKAAALRALQTTGKGLAAVAALPLAVTGGLLYGGYRGAQAGVRAGKARYASYTTEQARRRELNRVIKNLVKLNNLNAEIQGIPQRYVGNSYFLNAYKKVKNEKIYKLAQRYANQGGEPPTQPNVKLIYNQIMRSKARKAAVVSGLKITGKKLAGVAVLPIKTVGTVFKKIKGKGMQKYEDELEQVLRNIANTRGKLNEIGPLFPINSQIARINQEIQTLPEGPGNNRNRLESNKQKLVNKKTKHTQLHSNAKELIKRKQELETILKRMQISKAGQVGILRKVYQRTQEYEAQKAGLDENLDKVAKQLERLNLAGSNRDKLEKRQREIKVRMAQLNRLIAKRNRPPPVRPQVPPQGLFSTTGAAPQTAARSGLAPALSTRGVPVNRMTNFSIKYEETSDERIKAQIIQQAYKLASDNMKKARTETELEEMYAQYRTLGPDSRRFKDLLDMGYKTIKSRIKSKRENRGNIGKLFGGGSGNLSKLLGSESTRKFLQELPTSQREAVKNAGGIARASSLIENAGGPTVVTRAAEVLKKSGGNVEKAVMSTPSIPMSAFQNVKKLGGPTTAVRTVRVVQVVKTRVRRRKAPAKKPRRVPTRKTKKKKKPSVATLKKIVHKLPRRNLEREALKWLSR
jgi:DNA repair exonuclease SbcCD ATPase subunit